MPRLPTRNPRIVQDFSIRFDSVVLATGNAYWSREAIKRVLVLIRLGYVLKSPLQTSEGFFAYIRRAVFIFLVIHNTESPITQMVGFFV